MNLEMVDLDALKDAAVRKFDDGLAKAGKGASVDREVAQLLAEMEQIYRVVALLQKNEADVERVAEIWGKMVALCDDGGRRLSALAAQQTVHRAAYDRILDLRNAAEERRRLHCRP